MALLGEAPGTQWEKLAQASLLGLAFPQPQPGAGLATPPPEAVPAKPYCSLGTASLGHHAPHLPAPGSAPGTQQ